MIKWNLIATDSSGFRLGIVIEAACMADILKHFGLQMELKDSIYKNIVSIHVYPYNEHGSNLDNVKFVGFRKKVA